MNKRLAAIAIIVAIMVVVSVALAQNGEFKLPWYRVAGGGGTSVDVDRFGLSGTIGQAEAGLSSDGTSFQLRGGYWHAGGSPPVSGPDDVEVFLPLLVRPR